MVVEAVDPEQIDVIRAQALEGVVDGAEEGVAGKTSRKLLVPVAWATLEEHTELVNVILGLPQRAHVRQSGELLFSTHTPCLCHQNELLARDVVFLDRLADDALTVAIGVDVRGIPLLVIVSLLLQLQIRIIKMCLQC